MTLLGSALRFKHMLTSATPRAGELALFAKSDEALWVKKSSGVEELVGGLVGAIPRTLLTSTLAAGWVGDVYYQKFGNVVTLDLAANKASWAINEAITTIALPVAIRPAFPLPAAGINSTQNNAPRSIWVGNDGIIRAAEAGTGSIWSTITYQVPSIERSTAMNSGAMTTAITPGSGVTIGAGTQAHVRGGVVTVDLNLNLAASMAHNSLLCTLPDGYRPPAEWWEDAMIVSSVETMYRVTILTNGEVRLQTSTSGPTGVPILRDSITFPAATSAAGLGTLVDTGWVSFTQNVPNVNCSQQYAKYRRVGNTVEVRSTHSITAGAVGGQWLINVPFPFAADTPQGISPQAFPLGRARAVRSGVAWYEGMIYAHSLATPHRASVVDVIGGGAVWTSPSTPAAFVAGQDYFSLDYTYEAAPL